MPDTGRVVVASSCVLRAQVTLERLRRMLHLVLGAALEAQFHAGCLSHLVSLPAAAREVHQGDKQGLLGNTATVLGHKSPSSGTKNR